MKRKDGREEHVPALSDWVHANFDESVLLTIQKTAEDLMKDVIVKDGKKSKKVSGFLNVESLNKTVMIDDEQITKLKYVPEKTVGTGALFEKDKDGKFKMYSKDEVTGELVYDPEGTERMKVDKRDKKTVPAKWIGYFGNAKRTEILQDSFVNKNFSKAFRTQVMSVAMGGGAFIKIPPGDDHQHKCITAGWSPTDAPPIHYMQKEGHKTCLVDSFASALHYLGIKQIASELFQAKKKIIDKPDTWDRFQACLESKAPLALKCNLLSMSDWKLTDLKETDLVAASLRGSDGKIDHAITIYGSWIFDSNFTHAMPLNQDSLDLCCSSDTSPAKFVCVEEARSYPFYHKLVPGQNRAKARKKWT